jgi:hypothetical protein
VTGSRTLLHKGFGLRLLYRNTLGYTTMLIMRSAEHNIIKADVMIRGLSVPPPIPTIGAIDIQQSSGANWIIHSIYS